MYLFRVFLQNTVIFAYICPQINVVFLCFAVRTLWKSKQRHLSTQQLKKKAKTMTLAK